MYKVFVTQRKDIVRHKDSIKVKAPVLTRNVMDSTLGRLYHEHKGLVSDSCLITVHIYDNAKEDNDTISVFFNSIEIVQKSMLKVKRNEVIEKTFELVRGKENELVFKAWNTGKKGLNTMKVEFFYGNLSNKAAKGKMGKAFAVKEFNSKPGLSSAILIKCN